MTHHTLRTTAIMRWAGAAALTAGAAQALAFVPWAPYPGPGFEFTHSGGGSDNGAAGFGVPTVVGNAFVFEPASFDAVSVNGASASADDRLQVDLLPSGISAFTQLVIIEEGMITGDLSNGLNGPGAAFTVAGDITVAANPTSAFPGAILADLQVTVTPIDANTAKWVGIAIVDLSPQPATFFQPVTSARLIFENVITAQSNAGSTTTVTKDRVQIFIPAPAGLALAGVGLLAVGRRRR